MRQLRLSVFNEYSKLKKVLVGLADTLPPLTPINSTQKYYYNFDPPKNETAYEEHKNFLKALKDNDIEVTQAKNIPGVDQRDIRDVVAVIGDYVIVCRLKEKIRKREVEGVEDIISIVEPQKIIYCKDGLIEGGDVIVDNDTILVGLGARTDRIGLKCIQDNFSDNFDVVPLVLNGDNALHLDTVLSIYSKDKGIIFPNAFDRKSLEYLTRRYSLLEVNEQEQFNLATNIFVLEPGKIVLDAKRNLRVAEHLESTGVKLINIKYTENNKIGGSFRCATAPLVRENP